MRVQGISKIVSPSLAGAESQGPPEVWDDCWESAMMFLRMSNDWVYAGMGSCIGMNKQTLQWYMEVHEVKDKKDMLEDLQVMERHALKHMNKAK
jgi:hypothetical protein